MKKKERLDREMIRREMAPDVDQASRWIMAGRVWVNGQRAVKADQRVSPGDSIDIEEPRRFVSRGGEKLSSALSQLPLEIAEKTCADVGSSTGGFTDCLLQAGARRVYAIDVGRGQLHWKLRQDDRVISMERTDARALRELPEPIDLATVDASFISLERLLPVVSGWLAESGDLLALVKPQFEAKPSEVEQGGLVRDVGVQRRVLLEAARWFEQAGVPPQRILPSEVAGAKGNQEYFLWGRVGGETSPPESLLPSTFERS